MMEIDSLVRAGFDNTFRHAGSTGMVGSGAGNG